MGRTPGTTHRWLFHVKATSATLLTTNWGWCAKEQGQGLRDNRTEIPSPHLPYIPYSPSKAIIIEIFRYKFGSLESTAYLCTAFVKSAQKESIN